MRNVFEIPADLEQITRLDTYPGVSTEESRPLREFFRRHAAENFDAIRFNVRVGVGERAPEGADLALKRAIEEGTRMRMDALGWKAPRAATLLEAKVQLANDGVWQLLGYRDAYRTEHPDHEIRLVLVCEGSTSTARTLAASYGIAVFQYDFAPATIDVLAPATAEHADGV